MSYLAGQVEAVVLVPGFGAIVRGWALHSLSQIGAVALEVEGGARFPILAEPVLAHERPDLRAQLKLAVDIYRLPGFAALISRPINAGCTLARLWRRKTYKVAHRRAYFHKSWCERLASDAS